MGYQAVSQRIFAILGKSQSSSWHTQKRMHGKAPGPHCPCLYFQIYSTTWKLRVVILKQGIFYPLSIKMCAIHTTLLFSLSLNICRQCSQVFSYLHLFPCPGLPDFTKDCFLKIQLFKNSPFIISICLYVELQMYIHVAHYSNYFYYVVKSSNHPWELFFPHFTY